MRGSLAELALGAALNPILSVVFPSCCPHCEQPLEEPLDGPLCAPCWGRVAAAPAVRCRCGRLLREGSRCGRCRRGLEPMPAGLSLGAYEGPLRAAIQELKYRGRRRVARRLAEALVAIEGAGGVLSEGAVLVPVPLHPRRERARGFNQSALIAAAIAKRLGLAYAASALRRRRDTPSQTGLNARQRRANMAGAFVVVGRREAIAGRRIVLVDDVLTTGATARACARALLDAGAAEVRLVVAARVD